MRNGNENIYDILNKYSVGNNGIEKDEFESIINEIALGAINYNKKEEETRGK